MDPRLSDDIAQATYDAVYDFLENNKNAKFPPEYKKLKEAIKVLNHNINRHNKTLRKVHSKLDTLLDEKEKGEST